ncbi:MAG TPA: hypothetical protein VGE76_05045, partial [Opitutaceae bacterium]
MKQNLNKTENWLLAGARKKKTGLRNRQANSSQYPWENLRYFPPGFAHPPWEQKRKPRPAPP